MENAFPLTRDLVLIGGGHTHALVLRRWGMLPLAGARLTLINPEPTAAYSGMLPGFVAGHYGRDDLGIDLVKLARFAGARLILGAVDGIDLTARSIHVPGRPPIAFDVASVDIGITSAMPALAGFAQHGIPAKPLTPFGKRWAAFRDRTGRARVAVIGGGVAGAELAMAMAHALRSDGRVAEVCLIDRSMALSEATRPGRMRLLQALKALGVVVHENAPVAAVAADHVELEDGRHILSDFTAGAAGALPFEWLGQTGLRLHEGFVSVNRFLQSNDPAIFAAGDCAHLSDNPRPKAGVFAVRQAPVLLDNLVAALSGGPMRPYKPQRDYLKLISLGEKSALAEKWGRAFSGPILWRWKDRIDRLFMDKLSDLPLMEGPSLPTTRAIGLKEALGDAPMCGGCGAKVGRGALRNALTSLPSARRADVEAVAGDDAAMLRMGSVRQVVSTDHLRAVTDDPVLMTRIAAIHALGDVWAMGATPQAATATVILPRMTATLQERTLAEVMSTAAQVMGDAGAAIIGGHSSMGSELTIGFTVTGLCEQDPITIAGARPGDILILTKPIGSGVILAAEMQGKASGVVVAGAYAAMTASQGEASRILETANAMTDVTGFGLAGHLAGICEASGVAAEVRLADVPLLPGALELAERGIASTILPDNRAGAGPVFGAKGARGALMFDPQSAGGLLAAVTAAEAEHILEALQAAGYPAVRIGKIVAGASGVTFR
ncbi:MAG: selenide, water dikinase SelD [Flavimaricola sp.]|nr:selenide, water dikinase SelD [Flavimaricola sp.]